MDELKRFDVALSFAGEERAYVDQVAQQLRDRGISVFYDLFEEANLWGKDLYEHLSDVYQNQARFTVMFISSAYATKLWTNHERRSAQARAFQASQEYILPARFDDTVIPGIPLTVAYISLVNRSPMDLVSLIVKKLVSAGGTVPSEHVRRDFSVLKYRPNTEPVSLTVRLTNDEARPIVGATIVIVADNNTYLKAVSDLDGLAVLDVAVRRKYRLIVAHPTYPGAFQDHVDSDSEIEVILPRTENIGSCVIFSTGHIPVIEGRLSPIMDVHYRTYLYADNVAINGGALQPVDFEVGQALELEDSKGQVTFATFKFISGRVSLVQYLRPSTLSYRPAHDLTHGNQG